MSGNFRGRTGCGSRSGYAGVFQFRTNAGLRPSSHFKNFRYFPLLFGKRAYVSAFPSGTMFNNIANNPLNFGVPVWPIWQSSELLRAFSHAGSPRLTQFRREKIISRISSVRRWPAQRSSTVVNSMFFLVFLFFPLMWKRNPQGAQSRTLNS